MTNGHGPLLLDTHCWLWSEAGADQQFTPGGLTTLRHAAAARNLLVSAISVWEIAVLESKGRIKLDSECLIWVRRALTMPGVSLVDLTPEIAVDSTRLPGGLHPDPADRILVATARRFDARLMTRDRALLDYGRTRHARIISA